MFFPRFSLRSLLALTAVAIAGFFVLGMAAEGYVWAGAASAVIVAGCVVAVVHAALFAVVWMLSQLPERSGSQSTPLSDPFAKQPYPLPVPSLSERIGDVAASPGIDTHQSPGRDRNAGPVAGGGD